MTEDQETDEVVRDSQWAQYQSWLRLQAKLQIDTHLRGKFDESDIAQQTMVEAWRSQSNFRGTNERQRLAWLKQVLAGVLGHELRRYRGTQKRDISLERSMERSMGDSSEIMGKLLPNHVASPSEIAQQREAEVILAELLEKLPDDYREVIVLRNLQEMSHEQVADRMGRSVSAARMLWIRALRALKDVSQPLSE